MPRAEEYYPQCPEALIVGLARSGDRAAFAELVRRRQSGIRSLMRRFCGDATLADDLAQQVFLTMWIKIRALREVKAFGGWLKRLAVSTWLQHQRRRDALRGADEVADGDSVERQTTGIGMDLDRALASLGATERACIVLSYQEGMTHPEIAEVMDLPLGTVKSHITRGAAKLREELGDYRASPDDRDGATTEESS